METALCAHCQAEFPQKTSRRRFCSDRCRKAAWTANKEAQAARLRGLVKVLAKEAGLTAEDLA